MKLLKVTFLTSCIFASASLYAETKTPVKEAPPYGDNPNIFVVLGHKAKNAVQNTANKVGAATERGIQKIKPKVDNTLENTKTYTEEQASLAKENTIKAKDKVVQKWHDTKDNVLGVNGGTVPIQQGQLSQSSGTASSPVATAPVQNTVQVAPANNISTAPETIQTSPAVVNQTVPESSNQPAPMIKTSKDNPIGGSDPESDYPH